MPFRFGSEAAIRASIRGCRDEPFKGQQAPLLSRARAANSSACLIARGCTRIRQSTTLREIAR